MVKTHFQVWARVPLGGTMEAPTSLGGGTEARMVPHGVMEVP